MRGLRTAFDRKSLVCLLAVACLACAVSGADSKARETKTSGFLKDYSQLKPGEKDQAQLLYVNPDAKFSEYKTVLMDPIKVYATAKDSALSKVPPEELKELLNYLDATVREQLGADYKFVTKAGPGTMRLRIALTEAKGAKVGLKAVSSVTPVGLALGGIKKAVTGASTGVGGTRAEMELVDAQSGKRLAAAVDERVGGKLDSFSKWEGAKEAFDYWAERLKLRMTELRTKK